MEWWQWMIVGGLLLGAELVGIDAQFYLIFVGLSALLVGLAELLGIAMPLWVQFAVFGVLSLLLLYVFRKRMYDKIRGHVEGFNETLSGNTVNIPSDLSPGSDARIDYRGTKWTARNVGSDTISGGSRAKVVKVDGLTLHVESE